MKVLITRQIPEAGLRLLREEGFELTEWREQRALSQEELISLCQNNDALLSAGQGQLNETFFQACSHLKALSLLSAGYDQVDVKAATKWKIPVGHTPGVLSKATADIAFLLLLAVSRNAIYMSNFIAKGEWGFYDPTVNLGFDIEGKTLGIFGLGRIGFELARKCQTAFGMKIIYHNRSRNKVAETHLSAKPVSFEELLNQSDVLSVHANLSEETKELFTMSVFRQMKSSAIFINTARGAIHNEADLREALRSGIIWGAGLDVTNPEPMKPDNELLRMPNVCVLPHIGSATKETRDQMAEMAAKNLIEAVHGRPMPHTVNPEVFPYQWSPKQ